MNSNCLFICLLTIIMSMSSVPESMLDSVCGHFIIIYKDSIYCYLLLLFVYIYSYKYYARLFLPCAVTVLDSPFLGVN
ncbi:hypothetical protein QVD17_37312 [Tagetes erecta]|uniref:Uncharacterized protein n=1 Tax=Tagetes erecta TaxID=13708 RepID=A0AAD8JVS9_TARER|nr:hypothetical protein QVD17_37312 [Tagetes erecta]